MGFEENKNSKKKESISVELMNKNSNAHFASHTAVQSLSLAIDTSSVVQ